jgi:hypothetical protein
VIDLRDQLQSLVNATDLADAGTVRRQGRRRRHRKVGIVAAVLAMVTAAVPVAVVALRTGSNEQVQAGDDITTGQSPSSSAATGSNELQLDFPLGTSWRATIPTGFGPPTQVSYIVPLDKHFQLDVVVVNQSAARVADVYCPAGCTPIPLGEDGRYQRWVSGDPTTAPPAGSSPELATVSFGAWTLVLRGPDFASADLIARALRGQTTANGVRLQSSDPSVSLNPAREQVVLFFGDTVVKIIPNCEFDHLEYPDEYTCSNGAGTNDPRVTVTPL